MPDRLASWLELAASARVETWPVDSSDVHRAGGRVYSKRLRDLDTTLRESVGLVHAGRALCPENVPLLMTVDLEICTVGMAHVDPARPPDVPSDLDLMRTAGRLLRRLHDSTPSRATVAASAEAWSPSAPTARFPPEIPEESRSAILDDIRQLRRLPAFEDRFTHGDFQPRNWMNSASGNLVIIDYETSAMAPAYRDFSRLEYYLFPHVSPAMRSAFYSGYGRAPSEDEAAALRLRRRLHGSRVISWAAERGAPGYAKIGWNLIGSDPDHGIAATF